MIARCTSQPVHGRVMTDSLTTTKYRTRAILSFRKATKFLFESSMPTEVFSLKQNCIDLACSRWRLSRTRASGQCRGRTRYSGGGSAGTTDHGNCKPAGTRISHRCSARRRTFHLMMMKMMLSLSFTSWTIGYFEESRDQ